YDLMLGEKLTRDPESKEMLDIIFDGISFDAGVSYFGFSEGLRKLFYLPSTLILNGDGAGRFASYLATNQPSSKAAIEQFNADVAAIPDAE
ncbi:MAG: hypothetical protein IJC71_04905, partial [Clostridia bacterium]|nr:hypothetical protein [Clostridia bacterium]